MTIAEVKNDLILKILQTNDPALLRHLSEYFQSLLSGTDWWEELSEKQKAMIRRGSEQIERGEVIPDSVVRAKARKILGKSNK